jgi:hypothetical protein
MYHPFSIETIERVVPAMNEKQGREKEIAGAWNDAWNELVSPRMQIPRLLAKFRELMKREGQDTGEKIDDRHHDVKMKPSR